MIDVKKMRVALGLTQAQLADRMQVSRVTVNQWECGRRNMRRSHEAFLVLLVEGIPAPSVAPK